MKCLLLLFFCIQYVSTTKQFCFPPAVFLSACQKTKGRKASHWRSSHTQWRWMDSDQEDRIWAGVCIDAIQNKQRHKPPVIFGTKCSYLMDKIDMFTRILCIWTEPLFHYFVSTETSPLSCKVMTFAFTPSQVLWYECAVCSGCEDRIFLFWSAIVIVRHTVVFGHILGGLGWSKYRVTTADLGTELEWPRAQQQDELRC